MIRWVYPLIILTGSASAQGFTEPEFDPEPLTACFADNAVSDKMDCVGTASGPCMETENGMTTIGMSVCLGAELDIWDARLNTAYQDAMTVAQEHDAGDHGPGVEKQVPLLKEMQRKWIMFRDATCAFERSQWGGGSGGGPAAAACMLEMTARQAEYLHDFRLTG